QRSGAGDSPTGAGRGAQVKGRRTVPKLARSGMMARQARVAPHRRTVVSPSMIKRPVPLTLAARRTPSRLAYWRTLLVAATLDTPPRSLSAQNAHGINVGR